MNGVYIPIEVRNPDKANIINVTDFIKDMSSTVAIVCVIAFGTSADICCKGRNKLPNTAQFRIKPVIYHKCN